MRLFIRCFARRHHTHIQNWLSYTCFCLCLSISPIVCFNCLQCVFCSFRSLAHFFPLRFYKLWSLFCFCLNISWKWSVTRFFPLTLSASLSLTHPHSLILLLCMYVWLLIRTALLRFCYFLFSIPAQLCCSWISTFIFIVLLMAIFPWQTMNAVRTKNGILWIQILLAFYF